MQGWQGGVKILSANTIIVTVQPWKKGEGPGQKPQPSPPPSSHDVVSWRLGQTPVSESRSKEITNRVNFKINVNNLIYQWINIYVSTYIPVLYLQQKNRNVNTSNEHNAHTVLRYIISHKTFNKWNSKKHDMWEVFGHKHAVLHLFFCQLILRTRIKSNKEGCSIPTMWPNRQTLTKARSHPAANYLRPNFTFPIQWSIWGYVHRKVHTRAFFEKIIFFQDDTNTNKQKT